MLEDILEEIEELKRYKEAYKVILHAQKVLTDELFKCKMELYNKSSREERAKQFIRETCSHCAFYATCCNELPNDILKPIKCDEKDNQYVIGYISCDKFEWSY